MGSSGSGKTSFLSILSNRIANQPNLKISGEVCLNKIPIKSFSSTHYIKYVLQEDDLFATQTTRDYFQFAAKLKIPNATTEQINKRVNKIIKELKLEKVADALIGNSMMKGLSGGEKKRVSIGYELISYPSVLILDEPTSGLDSITAENIINVLKQQAIQGKIIIFTIHQPSSKIFQMFDKLILMSEGLFVYQGIANQSIDYFSNIGYECHLNINPPDFYMRLLYVENRNKMTENERNIFKILSESYNQYSDRYQYSGGHGELAKIEHKISKSASFYVQLCTIFRRSMLNAIRQPVFSVLRIIQAFFMSIIMILLYHNNTGNFASMQNYTGALFFSTFNSMVGACQCQLLTFPFERRVFIKEYKENLYGVMSYFIAKLISEIPIQFIYTIIYSSIIYFIIPYNTESASKFFIFFGVSFISQISGSFLGYAISSFTNNYLYSIVMGPTVIMVLMIYGGYFANVNSYSTAFG